MNTNPYQSPTSSANAPSDYDMPPQHSVAPRIYRLAAAMIDGVLLSVITLPMQFLSGFFARAMKQEVGVVETLVMSLVGMAVFFAINGYLLINRGQTVGKLILKIQIVDFNTDQLLPLMRVYVIRYLWLLPLSLLVAVIPGPLDDNLISLAALIDMLFIFGAAQRCVHDYLAGSKVVMYQPNRSHL